MAKHLVKCYNMDARAFVRNLLKCPPANAAGQVCIYLHNSARNGSMMGLRKSVQEHGVCAIPNGCTGKDAKSGRWGVDLDEDQGPPPPG